MNIGILGMFGTVPFWCSDKAVLTFSGVQVSHPARYAVHDVIGGKPVPEFVGPGQKEVSFSVHLMSAFNAPPSVWVPVLETMLDSGQSYRLLLGPDYFGAYCLDSFSEDRKFTDGHGIPIDSEVSLTLKEASGFNIFTAAVSAARSLL